MMIQEMLWNIASTAKSRNNISPRRHTTLLEPTRSAHTTSYECEMAAAMERYILLGVLILTLFISGCKMSGSVPSHTENKTDILESEEFSVYNVLINKKYAHDKTQLIVIQELTSGSKTGFDRLDEGLKYVSEKISGVEQEVFKDFSIKNSEAHRLQDKFNLKVKHVIEREDELQAMMQTQDFWGAFYKKHPGAQGLITLSRVGFNNKIDQALVYIGNAGGSLGGAGFYVLLTKKEGIWIVQSEIQVWVL